MTNYLRQDKEWNFSKQGRRPKGFFTRIFLIVILACAMVAIIFPNSISSLFYGLVSPLWRSETDTRNEYNNLNQTIAGQRLLEDKVTLLTEENDKLKQAFGRNEEKEKILAVVLKRPPTLPYDTLIIDAGSLQGILPGALVEFFDGGPIGIVDTVGKRISKVMLFSSPGFEQDVLIGPKKMPVTATGNGGGNFSAKVPHDANFEVGDVVLLPSLEPEILGVIERIDIDPSRTFKMIYFKLSVSMNELNWVKIHKTLLE